MSRKDFPIADSLACALHPILVLVTSWRTLEVRFCPTWTVVRLTGPTLTFESCTGPNLVWFNGLSFGFNLSLEIPMKRLLLSLACLALFAAPAWAQAPGCCPETCCETTMQTRVSYVPVTTMRVVKYVDACGCCRTKCVPCTTYRKVCTTVPVTTCRQVAKPCCPAPAVACCPPAPCCPVAARPVRPRRLARRTTYCCL